MQNPGAGKTALGLDNNVGALLCYLGNLVCALGLIYSIIVIVTDKTNKLPRFHAFQSILLSVVGIVIGIVLNIIAGVAAASNSAAIGLLVGLIALVFGLGMLIAVIFTAVKAFQGQVFKLPVIGDMADKWSN
jgi:uncharacterized membrane protein